MSLLFLAIEIGGTKLQLFTGDAAGNIHQRHRFAVDPARGGEGIRAQIAAALREILTISRPAAIGVGFGGPVDWRTGRIGCSHQVAGWHDFELGRWLAELAACPVAVDNDANVATLGEAHAGAGRGGNPVFYVTLGSGVGGGLVVNGAIYHGATPGEAEIGHLRLDRAGTIVEQRCSGWAVDQRLRELRRTAPDGALARMLDEMPGGEAKHLPAALAAGDPEAQRILDETAADLAFGLSHVTHLFHPEVIVLGGGLALIGEPLRAAVEGALRGFVMEAFAPGPKVRLAELKEDAVPVGAFQLASGLVR